MKSKLLLSLVPLALGGLLYGYLREPTAKVVFFSVGQGDSTLFQAEGVNVLIDAGPARDGYDAGRILVVPKLREHGVGRLSLVFLTHPDSDHIGGAGAVLERYPEARLVVNRCYSGHPDLLESLRRWKLRRESVIWVSGLTEWRFGDSYIRCYAPPSSAEDNAASLVLQLESDGAKAVVTGDAPAETEMEVAKVADWTSDVMTAGHHGSRSSTSYPWLREVRPSKVVVSCGRDNPYGHPAEETLVRLKAAGPEVARTDLEGDIAFIERNGRFIRQR